MILYHLTWESNLESITEKGLIPNFRPNGWTIETQGKCKGLIFLCELNKIPYWENTLYNRMWEDPGGTGEVIVLEVECDNNLIERDSRDMFDNIKGDWVCRTVIPANRIKKLEMATAVIL